MGGGDAGSPPWCGLLPSDIQKAIMTALFLVTSLTNLHSSRYVQRGAGATERLKVPTRTRLPLVKPVG